MVAEEASGIGFTTFWSTTPAYDFHESCFLFQNDNSISTPIRILLVGIGDIHHILMTASSLSLKMSRLPIHFYLLENKPEILARLLLLLDIVNNQKLTIKERVDLFLDIYGNTKIRSSSESYIENRIQTLTEFICEENDSNPLKSIVDLTLLTYRNRDDLVDVVKSWAKCSNLDISNLRETRLRHYYAKRFDFRVNVIDWNYQMYLKPFAPSIHWLRYKEFAMTGISYEVRFASQKKPNRTLASCIDGVNNVTRCPIQVKGFWGDIVNPPFIAYGVKTDEKSRKHLFRQSNDQYIYDSREISEYNLMKIINALENRNELTLGPISEVARCPFASLLEDLLPNSCFNISNENNEKILQTTAVPGLQNIRIIPFVGNYEKFFSKNSFANMFDICVVGAIQILSLLSDILKSFSEEQIDVNQTQQPEEDINIYNKSFSEKKNDETFFSIVEKSSDNKDNLSDSSKEALFNTKNEWKQVQSRSETTKEKIFSVFETMKRSSVLFIETLKYSSIWSPLQKKKVSDLITQAILKAGSLQNCSIVDIKNEDTGEHQAIQDVLSFSLYFKQHHQ